MTPSLLSVVIPTRDGAATLPSLLDALDRQQAPCRVERVVIDSGSTDGTVDLVQSRVDRLIEIPASRFDHGLTRNLGIEASRGELVVLLVQDAVPATETMLTELVAPLLSDERVAGCFARQRPRSDAGPLTRHYLSQWIATRSESRVVELEGAGTLEALSPVERLTLCAFDNVCSCLRRDVWRRIPFRATPIAEDLAWGRDVLLDGQRIAYVPDAVVVHSHYRPASYELARTRALHRQLFELFGLRTIPTLPALARAVASTLVLHARLEGARPSRWPRATALALAWPLGQYLGGRDAWRAVEAEPEVGA